MFKNEIKLLKKKDIVYQFAVENYEIMRKHVCQASP